MADKKGPNELPKKTELLNLSRRQFLNKLGIGAGGVAFAGILSELSGCRNSGNSNPRLSTSNITSSSSLAPTSTSSTSGLTGFTYVSPSTPPVVEKSPYSDCTVAMDRLYSQDHVWVKEVDSGIVAVGITPTMVWFLGEPYTLTFPEIGSQISRGEPFSSIEGFKISADLLLPVGGKVVQINEDLNKSIGTTAITDKFSDPFNAGWLIVVQLADRGELNSLLTPDLYLGCIGGEG